MREIKFRAWDKKRGRFHWGISNICLTLGGNLMWQFGFHAPNILEKEEAEDYVLQQYTGLKDKNGVGIYEGDILHPMKGSLNMFVLYEDGYWRARDKEGHDNYSNYFRNWEIIGNIYENLELLGGE